MNLWKSINHSRPRQIWNYHCIYFLSSFLSQCPCLIILYQFVLWMSSQNLFDTGSWNRSPMTWKSCNFSLTEVIVDSYPFQISTIDPQCLSFCFSLPENLQSSMPNSVHKIPHIIFTFFSLNLIFLSIESVGCPFVLIQVEFLWFAWMHFLHYDKSLVHLAEKKILHNLYGLLLRII